MAKIRAKQSLRLDGRVRRNAKNHADKMGWELGELIISALKSLEGQPAETWVNSLPDGWALKRPRKANSIKVPLTEKKFVDSIKKKGGYSFDEIVEMALFNKVPALRRIAKKPLELKTVIYQCVTSDCGHMEERKKGTEFKCRKCKSDMLPKAVASKSHYKTKLNNLLRFIQYGSTSVPDISDIDAETVKKYFVRKLKKAKKELSNFEDIENDADFTPIMMDVYPSWQIKDMVIVGYKGEEEGVYDGTVTKVQAGRVHIRFEDKSKDNFPITGKETKHGGIVLGRWG